MQALRTNSQNSISSIGSSAQSDERNIADSIGSSVHSAKHPTVGQHDEASDKYADTFEDTAVQQSQPPRLSLEDSPIRSAHPILPRTKEQFYSFAAGMSQRNWDQDWDPAHLNPLTGSPQPYTLPADKLPAPSPPGSVFIGVVFGKAPGWRIRTNSFAIIHDPFAEFLEK